MESEPATPPDELVWFGRHIRLPAGAIVKDTLAAIARVDYPGGRIDLGVREGGVAERRTWVEAGEYHALRRMVDEDGVYECTVTADSIPSLTAGSEACDSIARARGKWDIVPRPRVAADVEIDVASETMFHDCTNPEGAGLGVSAGVGVRPERRNGFGVRAGVSLAGLAAGQDGKDVQRREQAWAGPTVLFALAPRAQLALTAFVTVSQYERDTMSPRAIGGGVALDVWSKQRSAFHLGLRLLADREGGFFGGMSLGWAWVR